MSNSNKLSIPSGMNSKAVHAGTQRDHFGGVNTPVQPSTAIEYLNESGSVPYPRNFTIPNHEAVATKIAALEGGEAALVLATGMSAITIGILAAVQPGQHVLMQSNIYGGTRAFVDILRYKHDIQVTLIDRMVPEELDAKMTGDTTLVYMETPANPLLDIIDISPICQWAKDNRILTMIDNTFASPVNQQPLKLGCDIIMHSATKYMGGHSDLMAGALIGKKDFIERCRTLSSIYGMSLNAVDLSLLERSIKTMVLRVRQQNSNAMEIAQWLSKHPLIAKVHYPGLTSHPGHEIAARQMSGFGGMMSFELAGNDTSFRDAFLRSLSMISVATSLGGVESTMTIPAQTSHSLLTPEERSAMGIHDLLIRFSIGIEDPEDLIQDLERALQ
ncbi:MAG: PLP-dependent transferase [Ignavibacteria bacterium]|nr:PLP-dependent transferase [Ignavibacteria bacterium]